MMEMVEFGGEMQTRSQFSHQQMVRIALDKTQCLEALARWNQCHSRTIGRIRDVVGWGVISLQELMLEWLYKKLVAHPPDWGLRSLLWDVTTFQALSREESLFCCG